MLRYLLLVMTFSFFSFANIPPQIIYNDQQQPLVVEYEDGNTILYEYDTIGRQTHVTYVTGASRYLDNRKKALGF